MKPETVKKLIDDLDNIDKDIKRYLGVQDGGTAGIDKECRGEYKTRILDTKYICRCDKCIRAGGEEIFRIEYADKVSQRADNTIHIQPPHSSGAPYRLDNRLNNPIEPIDCKVTVCKP